MLWTLAIATLVAGAVAASAQDELAPTPSRPAVPSTLPSTLPSTRPMFTDSFDNLANWISEGPHTAEAAGGQLRIKTVQDQRNNGQFVWCRKELPKDFRLEFEMTPMSDSGFFLIFFCVEGVKGEDILGKDLFEQYMPAATWKEYHDWDKYTSPPNRKHESRIRGYHISYRRNELANCNLRKNPGLNLLKSNEIDARLPKGELARVRLSKEGARIRLEVNGRLFMDFTDDKDPWPGGRWGFRQVYDAEGMYDNVRVTDLGDKGT